MLAINEREAACNLGARRLALAILKRAVFDARRGDEQARAFLAGDGAHIAQGLGVASADIVRAWTCDQGDTSAMLYLTGLGQN